MLRYKLINKNSMALTVISWLENLDCGNFIYVACYFSSRRWHEIFNVSAMCQKLQLLYQNERLEGIRFCEGLIAYNLFSLIVHFLNFLT